MPTNACILDEWLPSCSQSWRIVDLSIQFHHSFMNIFCWQKLQFWLQWTQETAVKQSEWQIDLPAEHFHMFGNHLNVLLGILHKEFECVRTSNLLRLVLKGQYYVKLSFFSFTSHYDVIPSTKTYQECWFDSFILVREILESPMATVLGCLTVCSHQMHAAHLWSLTAPRMSTSLVPVSFNWY